VNGKFESRQLRVKVPLLVRPQSLQQQQAALAAGSSGGGTGSDGLAVDSQGAGEFLATSVEEDRKHLLESVIVRIMKSRRTLGHNQLVVEVTKHLQNRFLPAPATIKNRIEKLIEREFLERSADDMRTYCYLA